MEKKAKVPYEAPTVRVLGTAHELTAGSPVQVSPDATHSRGAS